MKPEVYEKLAATGRYYNTGKVLIGVQHVPQQKRVMSKDEERIQSALLGQRIPMLNYSIAMRMLYVTCLITLVLAIGRTFA